MNTELELGLDTFGDVTTSEESEGNLSYAQVLRNLVEQGKRADELGVDYFGVGEHHRPDFAVSTPETVLAGIATVTERIKLGSGVTVLSSDDPVRVFQRFATIDGLSSGRAEVTLGRGSFIESFPLFGYELSDYEVLFEEKLDLFAKILGEGPVTWSGSTRASLENQEIYPKSHSGSIPTWVGVGGTPRSVVRTAQHGLNLSLAIIGGDPLQFKPFVKLFREALEQFEFSDRPVGVHSPGHLAETDEQAKEELWPHYLEQFTSIGRERGWGQPTRTQFEQMVGPHGSLYVGSPETVAKKIAATVSGLGEGQGGIQRFDLKYGNGRLPHSRLMNSIELYGEKVIPMVKDILNS